MAVLNATQLTELRERVRANMSVHFTKGQVNAALQAVEDRMQLAATKTAIGSDIEAAAPGVFNASEKTLLFGVWCVRAAVRLGIL